MESIDVKTVLDVKTREEITFKATASLTDEEKNKAIEENTLSIQKE